jgi:hypothetical protein
MMTAVPPEQVPRPRRRECGLRCSCSKKRRIGLRCRCKLSWWGWDDGGLRALWLFGGGRTIFAVLSGNDVSGPAVTPSLALLFKIAVPPVLVAFMSLAARRFGPTMGGLLMGLPWMTGPVLYFLSLDRDASFATRMCTGVQLGTFAMAAFALVYVAVARIAPWYICLPAAAAAFASTGYAGQSFMTHLPTASAVAILALLNAHSLIPEPSEATPALVLPWWDLPARMAATFALVACIMISAENLGPQLSGLVSSYPVILTVVGSFTHHQLGRDASLRLLKAITLSLVGFSLFFLTVGLMTPHVGLAGAFGMGALASLVFNGTLIWRSRRKVA